MANSEPEMIGWDSCIVLDCLEKKEAGEAKGTKGPYHWIKPLVDDAEAGKLVIVVSTLAIAETVFIRDKPPEEQVRILDEFYDYPWVRPEAPGIVIGKVARDLRRSYKIDGIDSIHVATAIAVRAPVFLTMDGSGRRKKTPLLPLDGQLTFPGGSETLRIRTPEQHQAILSAAAASGPLFETKPPESPPATPADETEQESEKK